MMEQLYDQRRIFGLDLMRSLAITMVLVGHCGWIFPGDQGLILQLMSLSGYLGVEIFFVLSGFLIGKILYQMFIKGDFRTDSVLLFLKRRWFRTLPNYYLILIVNLIIAFYIGYKIDGAWRYFFFLQNFATPMLPFFTESWSLSIEEFAYLVLPFTLFLSASIIRSRRKTRHFVLVISCLLLLFLGNKFYYHYQTFNNDINYWNISLKSVVIYRLDAIFIGVLCSCLYSRYRNFWKQTRMLWCMIGIFMLSFLVVGVGSLGLFITEYPFFWNVIYLPMTSITVALFLPVLSEWQDEHRVMRIPVTFMSLISYSVYLLHYGVVLQLMHYHFDIMTMNAAGLVFFTTTYFVVTIVLSYLLYRFYEKPMTDRRELAIKANLERFFPLRRP